MKRAPWLAVLVLTACPPKQPPEAAAETETEPAPEAQPAPEVAEEAVVENPLAVPDGDDNGQPWSVVRTGDFAVAVPDGWEAVEPPDDHVLLMRVGDGVGIPPIDEYGQPLQAGFIIEKREGGEIKSASGLADELLASLMTDENVELTATPARSEMILCDGTPAEFVVVGFTRPEEQRKSLFTQIFTGSEGQGWIASGYMVSGPLSGVTEPDSLAATWMSSHTMSFCPDPAQFDDTAVRVAYEALEQAMVEAVQELENMDQEEIDQDPTKTGTERPVEPPDDPAP